MPFFIGLLTCVGWIGIDPTELWSADFWGRIFITIALILTIEELSDKEDK